MTADPSSADAPTEVASMPQPTNESTTQPRLPDLLETASQIKRRERSPIEVVEAALRTVEALNPVLNAYITVLADEAMAAARLAEREIAAGRYLGPLHGIPLSVKDFYWTAGIRTTGGSRLLTEFLPDED